MSQRNAGDGFLNTSSELGRHTSHGSNDSEVWLKIVIRCSNGSLYAVKKTGALVTRATLFNRDSSPVTRRQDRYRVA